LLNRKSAIIVIAAMAVFMPCLAVSAEEGSKYPSLNFDKGSKEPVIINGDTVEYDEAGKTASANGNVTITYQDLKVTCKKAMLHSDTKEVVAEGDVVLTQGQNFFKGERVVYNIDTKTGTVIEPSVFIDPTFYGGGEKAEKLDQDHYFIKRGYVTTCNKEEPHYRIQSKQLNVYLGDRVSAKNILLFVGKVPILYFPYYSHSLKDRHPGVTVIPGKNDDWGYFVLTSWRYYFNDNFRGRIHIDYREKRDFAYGITTNYGTEDYGSGIFRFNYFDEKKNGDTWSSRPDENSNSPKGKDINRYRAQLRHKWQMDPATQGVLEFNKMSDANVIKDYYIKDYQRDMVNSNYASVIRTENYYTTSLLVQKQVNRFDSVVEYLPEVKFETTNIKIGKTDFYYEGEASAANLNKKEPSPLNSTATTNRFDTNNRLSYQSTLFGWLSVTPYAGTQQTFYSRDLDGQNNLVRGNFFTGTDVSTRFYRTYNYDSKAFNMEINGIRHVISPSISYYYSHEPTVNKSKLGQFDEIDNTSFANYISPSLENKLQTKRMVGGKMTTVDLARFIVDTDYHFATETDKGGRLGNYGLTFESKPYNWMRILSNAVYNPHGQRFESFTFNFMGNPELDFDNQDLRQAVYTEITSKKWGYGGGYRWDNDLGSLLEGQLMFNVTPKWKVTAYNRLDLKRFGTDVNGAPMKFINSIAEQEYRVSRDLHCWIGDFVYNISRDHGHTFMVIFRLKAFPDVPVELEQNYNPPMFGSAMPPG
jgi:lipopolysaccharide assembly outer membrane protein LptD (OstA)